MEFLRVDQREHLLRDTSTQAILNTNTHALRKHQQKVQQAAREAMMDERINKLEASIDEIKRLLVHLATQDDNG